MATSDLSASAVGEQCPECHGPVRPDGIDRVCESCGLVVETDDIDHGPEWRTFGDQDDRDKVRAAPANAELYDGGLGSEVGFANDRDDDGWRLHRQNRRAKWSRENRTRAYAGGEVTRIAAALELGDDLRKQANRLFRQLHERGLCNGLNLDTLAATCVYTISRVHQRGLTPAEVAAVARTDAKPIARRHTWVCDELDVQAPPPSVEQRARMVVNRVDVSGDVLQAVLDRLDDLPDTEVHRGSPSTIVAAVIYAELSGYLTQTAVSEAAGVSPAALRNRLGVMEADDER